jgi:hypothetical protein
MIAGVLIWDNHFGALSLIEHIVRGSVDFIAGVAVPHFLMWLTKYSTGQADSGEP